MEKKVYIRFTSNIEADIERGYSENTFGKKMNGLCAWCINEELEHAIETRELTESYDAATDTTYIDDIDIINFAQNYIDANSEDLYGKDEDEIVVFYAERNWHERSNDGVLVDAKTIDIIGYLEK